MFFIIEQVKEIVRRTGSHFFEPDTMRFFKSRVSSKVYPTPNGAFFVTSERFNDTTPRTYTVRRVSDAGTLIDVEINGKTFEHFTSPTHAHKVARRLASLPQV
jgi:hypothetical protein